MVQEFSHLLRSFFDTFSGLLTTPQLHYIVRCQNDSTYGAPTEVGYYEKVRNALAGLNFVSFYSNSKKYLRSF